MAKQVTAQVKLQCPGGSATPAPPVGPALGAHGVNIGQFVKQFNDKTAGPDTKGLMLPVIITVYSDRSFEFKIKSPPAAILIKLAAKIPAGKKQGKEVIPAEHKKAGHTITRQHKETADITVHDRRKDRLTDTGVM